MPGCNVEKLIRPQIIQEIPSDEDANHAITVNAGYLETQILPLNLF